VATLAVRGVYPLILVIIARLKIASSNSEIKDTPCEESSESSLVGVSEYEN